MTPKPPGVMLVDMEMYEELLEKKRARDDKHVKLKRDEAQGRADRQKKPTLSTLRVPYQKSLVAGQ